MNIRENRDQIIIGLRKKALEYQQKLESEGSSLEDASYEADVFIGDQALRSIWPEGDGFIGGLVEEWQRIYAEYSSPDKPFEDQPRRQALNYVGSIIRRSVVYRGEILPPHFKAI